MNELTWLEINTIAVVIGAVAAIIGILIAFYQIRKGRKELRRSYSPLLVAEFRPIGSQNPITFSQLPDHPVVQNISFFLRNNGNGPALNMEIEVYQGSLRLERSVHPSWASCGISFQETYRNSLIRGDKMACYFSVIAGYTPPEPDQPLRILITCDNAYNNRLRYTFEVPMDFLSAVGDEYRSLTFMKMEELKN